MLRACSFLPAATEIICQLGLEEQLRGVTFECRLGRPHVVRSNFSSFSSLSSAAIDQKVRESKQAGKDLYSLDEDLLQSISPELIFIQDVCSVCQIDSLTVERALARLNPAPTLISLQPHSLSEVLENVSLVAEAFGEKSRGESLRRKLDERIASVTAALAKSRAPLRTVSVLEWLNPIYNCGHWIPDLLLVAGGRDELARPGGYSAPLEWKALQKFDPEVIILAPCGFAPERTLGEMEPLVALPGWGDLRAVKNAEVYVVDGNFLTEPSTNLVSGIEILASLIHPGLFPSATDMSAVRIPLGR